MAIIQQKQLFGWKEIDELGDLQRLLLVINYIPDEGLMKKLELLRGKGRNDYPVRAVWNSILAGIVYQHPTIESLRRELSRNAQLREVCGFDLFLGEQVVPPAYVYSRYCRKLMQHGEIIENIFTRLLEEIRELLPDFGKVLAIDSKAINSLARRKNREESDGRRDTDADFGTKTYRGTRKDGTMWEKTVSWFGYKLHLVVDAVYELPVDFLVTKASVSDVKAGHELIDRMGETKILEICEVLTADKGYDDIKLIKKLWGEYEVRPVIDIRNMWKDGEKEHLLKGKANITYNYKGTVYCYCPVTNKPREMAFGGFEKNRETLKYRCPAKHYGLACKGMNKCCCSKGLRVPLKEEERIFTPLARSSYKWRAFYKKRTSVERVNGRLDESYGFEKHFIRGLQKMKLRCTLAMIVMLAMAVGRIHEKQKENMRSLVRAA